MLVGDGTPGNVSQEELRFLERMGDERWGELGSFLDLFNSPELAPKPFQVSRREIRPKRRMET